MNTLRATMATAALIALTGCADPMGPTLGFGPELDGIAGLLILAILFLILYRPARRRLGLGSSMHHTLSPKDIARERYARGELSQEDVQRIMQQLSESQGDSA